MSLIVNKKLTNTWVIFNVTHAYKYRPALSRRLPTCKLEELRVTRNYRATLRSITFKRID